MNTRARVEMSESYRGRHGNNSLFHNDEFNWDIRWLSRGEYMSETTLNRAVGGYVTRMQTTNNLTQDYCAQEYCEVL